MTIMTLPNLLTLARFFAALSMPLIVLLIDPALASRLVLVIFTIAALTDMLDGWIARRFHLESDLGRILDPIADKVLAAIALLTLCILLESAYLILLPGSVIVFRDYLVATLRESGYHLPSSLAAKIKTALLMLSLFLLLVAATPGGAWLPSNTLATIHWCGIIGLWGAAVLAVITAARYVSATKLFAARSQ